MKFLDVDTDKFEKLVFYCSFKLDLIEETAKKQITPYKYALICQGLIRSTLT